MCTLCVLGGDVGMFNIARRVFSRQFSYIKVFSTGKIHVMIVQKCTYGLHLSRNRLLKSALKDFEFGFRQVILVT